MQLKDSPEPGLHGDRPGSPKDVVEWPGDVAGVPSGVAETPETPLSGAETTLAERIAHRIRSQGLIRAADFIEAALYDPDDGFYTKGRTGRRGDYITAAEVGPLFGAVVGAALYKWWAAAGHPAEFDVVEIGAGSGALARSVLAAGSLPAGALSWWMVEPSAHQRRLHPDGDGLVSVDRLEDATESADVVLLNEVLDNCAFRIVERDDGRWREVLVALDPAGRFVAGLGPVVRGPDIAVAEGVRLPLHDSAVELLRNLRRRHRRARIVVFDYAAPTSELARRSPHWLRTYAGHRRGHDWLTDPGGRDITCDLAVEQIVAAFADAPEITTQARWLRRHGIDDLVTEGRRIWRQRAGAGDLAAMRARSRVSEAEALLDPAGLGGFTVFEWAGSPRASL